jgi:peptidoglycan/LPS O-acetylase OafA/YrhL
MFLELSHRESPDSSKAPPQSKSRVPELDGVRGVAILFVIYYHYFHQRIGVEVGTPIAFLKTLSSYTWSGIDLFFVLSGFLIGGILYDARASNFYFRTFYIRRVFRILPLYLMFCLLFFLATQTLPVDRLDGLGTGGEPVPWLAYATFTQNFWIARHATWVPFWLTVSWSLAIEEHFYLVCPFLIRYVKKIVIALFVIILAAPCFRILAYLFYQTDIAAYVISPGRADALGLGVLGAILLRREGFRTWLTAHSRELNAGFLMLQAGVLLISTNDPHHSGLVMMTIGYSWLACYYLCVLLIAVSQPDNFLSRILRSRPLIWIGSIAYGAYLLHQAVNSILHALIFGSAPTVSGLWQILTTFLAVAVTFGLARLSWLYFEWPLLSLGYTYSKFNATDTQPLLRSKNRHTL